MIIENSRTGIMASQNSSKLSVLFWCSHINPGGGVRLLLPLIYAVAKHPEIRKLRLAAPQGSISPLIINSLTEVGVEFFWLNSAEKINRLRAWFENNKQAKGLNIFRLMKHVVSRILYGKKCFAEEQLNLAANGCDLIYVIWPHKQTFPGAGKPVVCTWQDTTLLEFPEILGSKATKLEFANTGNWLAKCAQVVVSSESTRIKLANYFGEKCLTFPIIHHAIKPDFEVKESTIDPAFQNTLPEKWIIYPSNITVHKNHYNLLIAWSRFTNRREMPLLLIGSDTQLLNREAGKQYPETVQALRLLGLVHRKGLQPEKDFFALGYVDDSQVLPLIKNATALIMPSLAEGGGSFPVEEALNLGIPVLCSDIPVMREHLAYRSAKIIWFDPESPDSILTALNLLLENYDKYKETAVMAMQDIRPSWDDVAAKYVAIFQETIKNQ